MNRDISAGSRQSIFSVLSARKGSTLRLPPRRPPGPPRPPRPPSRSSRSRSSRSRSRSRSPRSRSRSRPPPRPFGKTKLLLTLESAPTLTRKRAQRARRNIQAHEDALLRIVHALAADFGVFDRPRLAVGVRDEVAGHA